jgi:hypothetical protein
LSLSRITLKGRLRLLRLARNDIPFLCFIILFLAGCQRAKQEQPKPIPLPAPSGRIEARLTYLEGVVSLVRDKARLPAELDMALLPGDTVETGKDAQAEVTFDDSSEISLDPESRFGIGELSRDSASGQRTVRTNLLSGELKARIAKLAQNSTFEIESPTSVAAVRGTEFIVACRPGQPVEVTVLVGKVGVRRPRTREAEVLLLEHHRLLVHPGRHLGRPFRLALGDEDLIRAKWKRWHERRVKVMERLRPRRAVFGPERPVLEKIKEKRAERRETIAPRRKASAGKAGGSVKKPKASPSRKPAGGKAPEGKAGTRKGRR